MHDVGVSGKARTILYKQNRQLLISFILLTSVLLYLLFRLPGNTLDAHGPSSLCLYLSPPLAVLRTNAFVPKPKYGGLG